MLAEIPANCRVRSLEVFTSNWSISFYVHPRTKVTELLPKLWDLIGIQQSFNPNLFQISCRRPCSQPFCMSPSIPRSIVYVPSHRSCEMWKLGITCLSRNLRLDFAANSEITCELQAFTAVAEWIYRSSSLSNSARATAWIKAVVDSSAPHYVYNLADISEIFGSLPHGYDVLKVLGFRESPSNPNYVFLSPENFNGSFASFLKEFFEMSCFVHEVVKDRVEQRLGFETQQSRHFHFASMPAFESVVTIAAELGISVAEAIEGLIAEGRIRWRSFQFSVLRNPPPRPQRDINAALTRVSLPKEIETLGRFNETSCSICLEPWTARDVVSKLVCDHVFHEDCIRPALENNFVCPICRRAADS